VASSVIFAKKLPKSKLSPNRRKSVQSGHPDGLPERNSCELRIGPEVKAHKHELGWNNKKNEQSLNRRTGQADNEIMR
jgi:hypothetical protein